MSKAIEEALERATARAMREKVIAQSEAEEYRKLVNELIAGSITPADARQQLVQIAENFAKLRAIAMGDLSS